jgi:hypothetical protein
MEAASGAGRHASGKTPFTKIDQVWSGKAGTLAAEFEKAGELEGVA